MSGQADKDTVVAKHDIYKCHVMTLIPDTFNRCDYSIIRLFNEYKPVRKIPKKDGWTFNYKSDNENEKERKEEIEIIEAKIKKNANKKAKLNTPFICFFKKAYVIKEIQKNRNLI
jgi:hypothetical protein